MRKKIITAYIIGIHLFLGSVLHDTHYIQRVEEKLGFLEVLQPEITYHFERMLNYHARMDSNVPNGSVVFIGDSITQGLCVTAVAPMSVNYGIGSDTTAGVLQRLSAYKSINRASAVVLAIGVNDMNFRSNAEILQNYSAIARQIPRQIPIIFSAVLPIDGDARSVNEWHGKDQQRIKALNAGLHSLVEHSDNRFFVDAGVLLTDRQGNLADKFHNGDGLHLNSKGNAVWIKVLQKTIDQAVHPILL